MEHKDEETRILSGDALIAEMVEVLREGDYEFLAKIANEVLVPKVEYCGDSMFRQVLS